MTKDDPKILDQYAIIDKWWTENREQRVFIEIQVDNQKCVLRYDVQTKTFFLQEEEGTMAEPKTEIDRRFDRVEEAIREITKLFGRVDVHDHIEKILRGKEPEREPDMDDLAKAETEGVDVENETVIPADVEEKDGSGS